MRSDPKYPLLREAPEFPGLMHLIVPAIDG